jgi:hypothetical protein
MALLSPFDVQAFELNDPRDFGGEPFDHRGLAAPKPADMHDFDGAGDKPLDVVIEPRADLVGIARYVVAVEGFDDVTWYGIRHGGFPFPPVNAGSIELALAPAPIELIVLKWQFRLSVAGTCFACRCGNWCGLMGELPWLGA